MVALVADGCDNSGDQIMALTVIEMRLVIMVVMKYGVDGEIEMLLVIMVVIKLWC